LTEQAQTIAELRQELAESLQREKTTAIENVRLFQELKESLEQQTATSEILGVIASSPTDLAGRFGLKTQLAKAVHSRLLCRSTKRSLMANELILIIEDNDTNRKLIRDLLQVKGYQTIESETAEDGLKLAEEKTPGSYPHGHPTLWHGRHQCDEAPQGGA